MLILVKVKLVFNMGQNEKTHHLRKFVDVDLIGVTLAAKNMFVLIG